MNQEAFDTFWYWINERHRIFLKKEAEESKPWTEDVVLQNWKFCNPLRDNDKQTRLLHNNVITPHYKGDRGILLFNIYAFRAFNWWPTYHWLVDCIGTNGWLNKWDYDDAVDLLEQRVEIGKQKLTSGAYMIRGREGMPKGESICQTLDHVWQRKAPLAYILTNGINTLQGAQELLMKEGFWGWGNFTTYQVVLDLVGSPLLEAPTDLNTWCEFGPGAERGIRCIWPDLPHRYMLEKAEYLLSVSYAHLEPHVPAMNLQDIEFSLCELSKYLRIKSGGKGKEGYAGHP